MQTTSLMFMGGRITLCFYLCFGLLVLGWFTPNASAATFHDFDNVYGGSAYTLVQNNIAPPPNIIAGGPTGAFLRLTAQSNHLNNAIDFALTDPGAFSQIVADFDFRVTPGVDGGADGFGFAFLNTANFGTVGAVELPGNLLYESPDLPGTLGVGFNVYPHPGDINSNNVAIHFNGVNVQEFDAGAVNLSGGQWIHAKITLRPGNGFSDVSVVLTPTGGMATTIVTNYFVPGFTPYEGRVHFGARTGGLNASQDLDNINVQYTNPQVGQFNWGFTNFTTIESRAVYLYVQRTNGLDVPATVQMTVANGSAIAGVDFTVPATTLSFATNEQIKFFTVPMLDNNVVNPSKAFTAILTNAVGAVIGVQSNAVVTIVDDDDPTVVGQWSGVTNFPANPYPLVPIHLSLLPTGNLLFWDRHSTAFGGTDGDPYIWNLSANTFTKTPTLTYDIFCGGQALLPDGRLFSAGGHISDGEGENKASIYDTGANTWTRVANDMNFGRWYPCVTALPTGEMLIEGGTYGLYGAKLNKAPQIYNPITGAWRYLTNAGTQNTGNPAYANYYPFMMVAPNGQVFCAGPQQMSRYLDLNGTGNWVNVAASSLSYRDYGTACMYDDGKVFMTGGNPHEPYFNGPFQYLPSRIAEVIDLNAAQPAWRPVQPMFSGRRFSTATLLADGQVLVTGGSSQPGFNRIQGATLYAEMWDPVTEQFTVMSAQARPRGYHCNSILLPDGRVVSTGGGHPNSPDGNAEPNMEFFSPPYLFNGPRPTIDAAPDTVTYAQTFFVSTPDAANIAHVNWLRLGNITHNFDQNQRINHLTFTVGNGGLNITAPTAQALCPPGHYMMFLLNSNGVPSLAKILQIGTAVTAVAAVGADNQITFSSLVGAKYQVERNDTVLKANNVWTAVGAPVTATGTTTTVTDPGAVAQPQRFYRVHQVP